MAYVRNSVFTLSSSDQFRVLLQVLLQISTFSLVADTGDGRARHWVLGSLVSKIRHKIVRIEDAVFILQSHSSQLSDLVQWVSESGVAAVSRQKAAKDQATKLNSVNSASEHIGFLLNVRRGVRSLHTNSCW